MSDLIRRQDVIDAMCDAFSYAYCDNCENEGGLYEDSSPCEECYRRYIQWQASKTVIEKTINALPSADGDRYIDRAELFNRLAEIKAPPEANEYKAEVYSLIQSM